MVSSIHRRTDSINIHYIIQNELVSPLLLNYIWLDMFLGSNLDQSLIFYSAGVSSLEWNMSYLIFHVKFSCKFYVKF